MSKTQIVITITLQGDPTSPAVRLQKHRIRSWLDSLRRDESFIPPTGAVVSYRLSPPSKAAPK